VGTDQGPRFNVGTLLVHPALRWLRGVVLVNADPVRMSPGARYIFSALVYAKGHHLDPLIA
jgi:hypothetical protein